MKTNLIFAWLILMVVSFSACEKDQISITPSGDVSSRQHTITDFTELVVSGPFIVQMTFSPGESQLTIEANENLQSVIRVEEKGGTLYLELEDDTNIRGAGLVLKAFLSVNNVQKIKATGTARVELQNLWLQTAPSIDLDGASYLSGSIQSDRLHAELYGASELHIDGTTQDFEIEGKGACRMDGFDFIAKNCTVDLEGGSEIELTVQQKLNVKAEGACTVYYKGEGIVQDQDLTGGSQIVRID